MNPADGRYIFGIPAYEKATIKVGDKELTVEAKGLSTENRYVESVSLNGTKLDKGYITHDQIMQGGKLTFVMTSKIVNNEN